MPVLPKRIDTVVIGGGQAGLTMSHRLSQLGRPHVVLERHAIADRWRSERWDGLHFQFPNWSVRLPDFPFPHADPDDFAPRDTIMRFIEDYAAFIQAPVLTPVTVSALRRSENSELFHVQTSVGTIEAANVVLATGPYQQPAIPSVFENGNNDLFQIHSSRYRNPAQLPPGGVLVVGAGASGAQIAEELQQAGRQVYLSVGAHRRLPRRYRGRDIIWWLTTLGMDETEAENRPPDHSPLVISGAGGGHTIDFRRFAADGMVLLGRAITAGQGRMSFAEDLTANLAHGDKAYFNFLAAADGHASRAGLDLPENSDAHEILPDPAELANPVLSLDLASSGIASIVWATGYGYDLGWVDLPVLDAAGRPVHRRGVTAVAGIYFLGLQWLHKSKSAFLSGVGDDAAFLAATILARG